MNQIRLQKFLSMAGVCSRRQGERHILAGDIRVNGTIITVLGTRVDPEKDRIEFCGKPVASSPQPLYIALNKPPGYVTSCKQPQERIVTSLVDIPERIFPVGRLDKESEGLLLLTNDGHLHQRLSHPSFDHEKVYRVTVARPIANGDLKRLAGGIDLDGIRTRPAIVRRLSGKSFLMTLREGRNRQIRRMAGKIGHRVKRLKRIRMANIRLGKLKSGQWRYLTEAEKNVLLNDVAVMADRQNEKA
ncbi:MAG: rRNA pseudouridine synthase [Deltaproteobacteria bacterium]|nr:MAG: rRNA pseudouridine synthase [Deltaproteobacteria bacterium]